MIFLWNYTWVQNTDFVADAELTTPNTWSNLPVICDSFLFLDFTSFVMIFVIVICNSIFTWIWEGNSFRMHRIMSHGTTWPYLRLALHLINVSTTPLGTCFLSVGFNLHISIRSFICLFLFIIDSVFFCIHLVLFKTWGSITKYIYSKD